jgi:hypothetical protein
MEKTGVFEELTDNSAWFWGVHDGDYLVDKVCRTLSVIPCGVPDHGFWQHLAMNLKG